MDMKKRKKLEKIYIGFCYHADLDTHVYSFVEFEGGYRDSIGFRIVVLLVIVFDALKEKMLDYVR